MKPAPTQSNTGAAAASVRTLGAWTIHEYTTVTSTNLVAAQFPIWTAVRAESQTAGRGRYQRNWVSDAGGLWLSAVVPAPTASGWTRLLPLIAGLTVCDILRECGITSLRMRWPNDVLVGTCKLAGLLVDQFTPDRAVVGIGINISNSPEKRDPLLQGTVARLSDLLNASPDPGVLAEQVLAHLHHLWIEVERGGTDGLLPRINQLWQGPRQVQMDIGDEEISGTFDGVDAAGRLRLLVPGNEPKLFEAHQVRLLRDV